MISTVRSALSTILGSSGVLQSAGGTGRIFELFILTGIAVRLQQRGLDVWLQRSDGSRISPTDADRRFIQRGGAPTGVAPASAGRDNASIIAFRTAGGSRWEIWNGIQFRGRSGATHEIDIALVPAEVGDDLRSTGIAVPFGRPRVAIECKDVGRPGSPDEMRALVARLYDLTILQSHSPYVAYPPPLRAIYPGTLTAHPLHSAKMTYWVENRQTMNVIARRTGFTAGSVALTTYYAVEPHEQITVGSVRANALLDSVAVWVVTRCP